MKKTPLPLFQLFQAVLLVVLLCSTRCFGQNVIYNHPASNSELSLIRHYKGDVDIRVEQWVFLDNGKWTTARSCNYVDRATHNVFTFYIPSYYEIGDFEILDSILYFCGSTNQKVFWGYFNIDDVFFSSGNIYCVEFPYSSFGPILNEEIFSLKKLEVFKALGSTHIVMLGNGHSPSVVSGEVIAEAWETTSGVWSFWYTMDTENLFTFQDLAITDNYVVVAGTYTHDPELFMYLHYNRPTGTLAQHSMFEIYGGAPSPSSTPAITPIHYTDNSIFSIYHHYREIFVRKTENDGFATICNNSSTSYVVSFYSTPSANPYIRTTFSDISSWLTEAAYNQYANSLCIVKGTDYLYQLTPSSPYVDKVSTDVFIWNSIDDIPQRPNFTISGSTLDMLMAKQWLYDMGSANDCIRTEELLLSDILRDQREDVILQKIEQNNCQRGNFLPNVVKSELVIECR